VWAFSGYSSLRERTNPSFRAWIGPLSQTDDCLVRLWGLPVPVVWCMTVPSALSHALLAASEESPPLWIALWTDFSPALSGSALVPLNEACSAVNEELGGDMADKPLRCTHCHGHQFIRPSELQDTDLITCAGCGRSATWAQLKHQAIRRGKQAVKDLSRDMDHCGERTP